METETERLFDTHVHLDLPPLREDLHRQLGQAAAAGVGCFLVPGVRPEGWPKVLELAGKYPGILAAPGVHPLAAESWNEDVAANLCRLLARPEVVAVGEIGLDHLLEEPDMDLQEEVFRQQLRLAIGHRRPVLVHCRRATERMLTILRQEKAERVGGILHAFSGSTETARQAVELGFAIGFGGTVTYPDARRAPEVLRQLPAEWIVLETDAPDLAPHPHRGDSNHPAWLSLIAARVAEIRGWTRAETARITTANARRVLHLDRSVSIPREFS